MSFEQKVVWMGTVLGDASVEEFEEFFLEELGYHVKFDEEFKMVDKDLHCIIFGICAKEIPKFALFRIQTPDMKWWEDFCEIEGVNNIPCEIVEKYNEVVI